MKNIFPSLLLIFIISSACNDGKNDLNAAILPEATTIILVRHANKADDGTSDPGLTPLGEARAQRLATMLAPAGVDAVYTTHFQRTRLTAKPFADLAKLELKEYDPRDEHFLSGILADHRGETLLIVGHSNTIPGMVNTLVGETTYDQLDEMEYDKLFIVNVTTSGKGRAVVLSF